MLEPPTIEQGMLRMADPSPASFNAITFAQAVRLCQKRISAEENPYKLTKEDYLIILRDLRRVTPSFRRISCKCLYKFINEGLYGKLYPRVSELDKKVMYQTLLSRIGARQTLTGPEVHKAIRARLSTVYYSPSYTRAFHTMKARVLRTSGLSLRECDDIVRERIRSGITMDLLGRESTRKVSESPVGCSSSDLPGSNGSRELAVPSDLRIPEDVPLEATAVELQTASHTSDTELVSAVKRFLTLGSITSGKLAGETRPPFSPALPPFKGDISLLSTLVEACRSRLRAKGASEDTPAG